MKLDAYFDPENGIIVTKAEGEVINENVKAAIKKASELSTEHNCASLLFDITLCKASQPLMYGYEQMKDGLINEGISLKHVCAVVYDPEIYPEDRARFIENVVANRMNPKFRMFKDINEAISWIKETSI